MQNIQFEKSKKISRLTFFTELIYIKLFIAAISIKSLYFHITTKISRKPYISSVNIIMSVSTLGIILIIAGLVLLIFGKRRKGALLFVNIFLSLLLFSDTLYYRYYSNPITIPVLYQLNLVSSVNDSITSLIRPKDLIYALDFPFFLVCMVFMKLYLKNTVLKLNLKKNLISSFSVMLIGLVMFQICNFKVNKTNFVYDNINPVKKLGIIYFHLYDSNRFLVDHFFIDRVVNSNDKELLNCFYESKADDNIKYKGVAEGKNLIIVQMEALQEFVVGKSVHGEEITPNINSLMKDSFYFNNYYYQVAGGNTSDAEFLSNASLYPAKEGAVYLRYPTNNFYTLPKLLKEHGYNSYVFHANNPNFWNRMVMYRSLGFDKFISYNDYVIDEFVGWNGWALSDASFFRQSLKKIDTGKPFYGFFITLSSHHPYNYFDGDYKKFDVREYEGTYLGRYFKAINYADKALGQFISELKKQNLFENTVVVIYGDHYAVPRDQSKELMKFLNVQYSDFQFKKLQKVPLIIHYPGMSEGISVTTTGGEIDLLPTIGNLMGIDTSYALGKDLLNTDNGYAVLRDGSVITDDFLYLNGLEKAYDIHTGSVIDKKDYEADVEALQKELDISDLILQKDAYRVFSTKNK